MSAPRGMSAPGGSAPRGMSAPGGSAPGGCLLPGGVCSGEVSALGGVCLGGCLLRGVCSALRHPPPRRDGYCCGRYASYWNAFLLKLLLGEQPTDDNKAYDDVGAKSNICNINQDC